MNQKELENYINDVVQKNVCLEKNYSSSHVSKEKIYRYTSKFDGEYSEDPLSFISVDSDDISLYESLERQITTSNTLSDEEQDRILDIIPYFNKEGYILESSSSLSEDLKIPQSEIEAALKVLKTLDPSGVGARDLQDCLLIQAQRDEKASKLVVSILRDDWEYFKKQELLKLSKIYKVKIEEIQHVFQYISKTYNPKPGLKFSKSENHTVVPEVYVEKTDNVWDVTLYELSSSKIEISQQYNEYMKTLKEMKSHRNEEQEDTYNFIRANLYAAKSLVKAIKDRRLTLYRVAKKIVEKQQDFFEFGLDKLHPMTLKDVALELELHESTVSRATSSKYLECSRGVFELKYFFHSSLKNSKGFETTNEAVKEWLKYFIDHEDKSSPLSDEMLSKKLLEEKKINISRRTVTKYRESLGLLSSKKRIKKF